MGVSALALIRPKLPHRAAGSIIQSASPWPFRGKRWAAAWTCCRRQTSSWAEVRNDTVLAYLLTRQRSRVEGDKGTKKSVVAMPRGDGASAEQTRLAFGRGGGCREGTS